MKHCFEFKECQAWHSKGCGDEVLTFFRVTASRTLSCQDQNAQKINKKKITKPKEKNGTTEI